MGENRLKRILIVENSSHFTGAFKSVLNLSRALDGEFDFFFAVPKGCWQKVSDIRSNRIYTANFLEVSKKITVFWYLPRLLINTVRLSAFIRKNSIEVVHVSDLYNMVGVCLKLLNRDIKLIYHIRLLQSSYAKPLYRTWLSLILRFANGIICVSNAVAKDIQKAGKTVVIYDAIPCSAIYSKPTLNNGSKLVKLLYVGNFIPGKGQDLALIALSKALKTNPNLRLTFVGGDLGKKKNQLFLKSLIDTAKRRGLNKFVAFSGPSGNVAKKMLSSDIVLNFSESESFSMVCLEALGCRVPLIATMSGGPEEIIRHNVNGILVQNRNTDEMASAINRLAMDKELRTHFAMNSLIDFATKFKQEELARRVKQVYLS
ncbi:MAG: hypothetical protein DHS20C17_11020 [Cyclobacteriaceae bacterium]|nr:MAG: hypothetical protein DHS20C17_11020 [Cyclobacteriaceae bacterium]